MVKEGIVTVRQLAAKLEVPEEWAEQRLEEMVEKGLFTKSVQTCYTPTELGRFSAIVGEING